MKTGNVILAIFLWLCIPTSIGIGFIMGLFTGSPICIIVGPLIFFILGFAAFVTGMEKKPQPPSSQPIIIQQPVQPPSTSQQVVTQQTITEETNGGKYMYNRNDLIFGIVFIAIGMIIFITALWSEPVVNPAQFPQWFFLVFRIIALVCVVAGIVGIIAAIIPKKQ
jgi:amino acid transporter